MSLKSLYFLEPSSCLVNFILTYFFCFRYQQFIKMADVLIRSFSKILSLLVGPTNVAIDNWTFQMFYKVTPMLLGACVILVCTRSRLIQKIIWFQIANGCWWSLCESEIYSKSITLRVVKNLKLWNESSACAPACLQSFRLYNSCGRRPWQMISSNN